MNTTDINHGLVEAALEALWWCRNDAENDDGYPTQTMMDARVVVLEDALAKAGVGYDASYSTSYLAPAFLRDRTAEAYYHVCSSGLGHKYLEGYYEEARRSRPA